MENEYTSIKDFLEMCEREGVRKESDLTQEEFQAAEAEQIARYNQGRLDDILQSAAYKLVQLFEENEQANRHNIAAQNVLLKALEDASNHPAMESSPEVKRIADLFHRLINYRRASFSFTPESIFEQILEPHEKYVSEIAKGEVGRPGGRAPKKPNERARALACWESWAAADNPKKMHRNKTAFVNHLAEQGLCDTKYGGIWVAEFRETHPSPALEEILRKTKKKIVVAR